MSDRAPTPERLRELARNADREAREAIGAALRHGSCPEPDISKGLRAASRFQKAAKPQVVAALVDRVEALAERIGNRSFIYMDNGHTFEAKMIGMIEEEIRALLCKPLEPGADDE